MTNEQITKQFAVLRTLIWNARFNLGYRIGGFTHARRDDEDEAMLAEVERLDTAAAEDSPYGEYR